MATGTYLNYYSHGMWYRKEVRSFENKKVILGSRYPQKDSFPQVIRKAAGHRLMSYELGVPPFFLICGRKVWVDGNIEPIIEAKNQILFARATKNGLKFICAGSKYSGVRSNPMIMSSVSLDGNTVRKGKDVPLDFKYLTKIAPFQSFNSTPSKFHSLNDISSTNLPIGHLPPIDRHFGMENRDPSYEIDLYSIGRDGLLPPIVIKEDDWSDKHPKNLEYTLNHFSKGSIIVKINIDGRMRARVSMNNSISADSFWFTEEEILINRETDKQRDD